MHTILRLLLPGYAQARNGERGKALLVAGAVLALFVLAGATPWLHSPLGLASFLAALIGTLLFAHRDARRHRGAAAPARLRPFEWALLALPAGLLLAALVARPLRRAALGLEMYRIPPGHESSAPVLQGGDRFLVDMRADRVARGCLAIFPSPETPGRTLVKRVVALGGDTVRGGADGVYVNGRRVTEAAVDPFGPVVVAPDEAFALGDNAAESRDSRHFGPFPVRTITGRPLFVVWGEAWDRIGTKLR